jgi:uncharacterized SAM-binding protein YcdF (DUF218 family)
MKWILGILATIAVILAVGIPLYLGPDDLRSCDISLPDNVGRCRRADAIISVSGGDTEARTAEAIDLYKSGWAPALVFSGAAQDPTAPSNALVMKRQALNAGVPEKAIFIDETSRTTAENAGNVKSIADSQGFRDVLLVTSAYHQRRASLEFKEKFKDMIVLRNHPVARDKQWRMMWWLTPSGWWLVGGELTKIIGFYSGASEL